MIEIKCAFWEGFAAHEQGVQFTANPYPYGSEDAAEWYAGWCESYWCGL